MSVESQRRVKPIDRDGRASIKAQMRKHYRKAKIAEVLKDARSAENNMRIYRVLKARLASRERLGRL